MNTYAKYCPNVFLAKCPEKHASGDIIPVTNKYGQDKDHQIHNLIFEKDGFFYYSITRADGFNTQERAKAKAERYGTWAASAEKKSDAYYEASQEGKDFLVLAEPIKIGHHSEKRHRALIERNWNRMGKSVEMRDKAEAHEAKAEYWEGKAEEINLSMPESVDYFRKKLTEAVEKHQGIKSGAIPKRHSYSLAYASKDVKELKKKLEIAEKLWA